MDENMERDIIDVDQDTLSELKSNANLVIEQMQTYVDFEFGFNDDSLEFLDGYIERQKADVTSPANENTHLFASIFGSFLGEFIMHTMGGTWKYIDGNLGVMLPDGDCLFPIHKAKKQLLNEDGDSIYSFYTSYKALRRLKGATPSEVEEVCDENGKVYALKHTYTFEDEQNQIEKKSDGLLKKLFSWFR